MKHFIVVLSAVFLMSCESDVNECVEAIKVEAGNHLYKNAIYFPGGFGVEFSGVLRNYTLVSSNKGNFDRYVFEFSEDMMAVEGAVFATLAKNGYQRKVKREDDRHFVVSYIKKGFAPIAMTYERVPAQKQTEALTRLKITWQNLLNK